MRLIVGQRENPRRSGRGRSGPAPRDRPGWIVCAWQSASGASSNGPLIGRHTFTIANRCLSNFSASSPMRSRTRCGPEVSV